MTSTIERSSPAQEASKINLEFISDEQLRQEISNKIDTLDALYRSYLSDPSQIPDEWKEDLEGAEPEDHAEVLAQLCIKSDDYYPDFTEDENPPAETKTLYNQIRHTAFEYLTSEEETVSADETPATAENSKAKILELNGAYEVKLETDLDKFAAMYAAKLAKETDRSLGQIFHEYSNSHIRKELTDMMGGIATHLMDKAEAAGLSAYERDSFIETKLTQVTDAVIQKMADARLEEYNESSAIRKFIYAGWNKWGEQGRLGKVKKGIVMGAISAPIALAAAPIAGVAVGAGLAGAIIATGSRSLGRGLISAHINQKANAPKNIKKQNFDIHTDVMEYTFDSKGNGNSFDVLDIIDSKVDSYRRRNRCRVLGGVGIALTVGLVSAKLADYVSDSAFGSAPAHASGTDVVDSNRHPLSRLDRQDMGQARSTGIDYPDRQDIGPAVSDSGYGEYHQDMGQTIEAQGKELNPTSGRNEMFNGYHGTRQLTLEGQKAILKDLSGHRIKSGESLWSLSEQALEAKGITNPTVYEIDATKDALLTELKHSSAVDSKGMLRAGAVLRFRG